LLALAVAGGLLLTSGLRTEDPPRPASRAGRAAASPVPLRATLRGHRGPVWSVAFAPDGRTLATGSDDTTLRLWAPATGLGKGVLSGKGSPVRSVAFAHSGAFLVGGCGDGVLRVWDAATGAERPALPHRNGNVRRVALSPDDATAA